MEIERRRSKVSFLGLFDCNGVSRKKLFPGTPSLPDELKQAKENVGNMPESQLNTRKVDENGMNQSSTANCKPSAGSDMPCETKAPCLVARLMGLDSLPASTIDKVSFTASRSSNSLVSSHCHEDAVVHPIKSRAHKVENRTIEARLPKNTSMRDLELRQKPAAALLASMHEKIMYTNTVEGSRYSENFHRHGSRGSSTLLAIQAKARVQCRDSLNSNGSRGHKQREQNVIASNQFFRSQKPILKQDVKQRTCTSRNSHYNEIEQNMNIQNSATIKVRSTSIVEPNKPTTRSSTGGASKVTNKNFVIDNVRASISGRREAGAKDEFSLIKTKSCNSMRKRYPKRDVLSSNVVNSYQGKSIKCNITTEESMNQDALNKKTGKGVISFTFTSPLKKESQPSTHPNNVHVSAPGLHTTDGDASSDLFNGKAQDLASRINSLECTLATRMPSAVSLPSEVSIESGEGNRSFHSDLKFNMNQQLQGSKGIRQHSSNNNIETEYCEGLNTGLVSQAAEQACGLSYSEDYNRPRNLKLEQVKDMLSYEKLVEESLSQDQTIRNEQVIKTNVFDVLEKWSSETESDGEENLKVDRNLLFDFVSEFLELRRSKGYKGRALESQIWWEEDLCREIKRFKSMQEIMVDELVNMDMSSPQGTWLHFQTEHFQQNLLTEIEWDISTSLITDLLLDLMHHYPSHIVIPSL
ncbi:hypothetical protein QN277_014075 [Acacia crassicarpa]|uniref:DUF3741 domain-containing protein n=1 Tax=Acacia crassicarpa TaxID=499986 RepID=A0AAE1N4Q1_9FABA|nr:hypothetical protein QN277_014075 [Acacia crassicarpa]